MDLWNHLQNAPELADSLWVAPAVIVGLGLTVAFCVKDFSWGIAVLMIATLSAAGLHALGAADLRDDINEHIAAGVTEYVTAQTELTPLEPVAVRDNTASLHAADSDGTLYDIEISWLPLDSADASGELPEGVDPIEMVVTKRDGNDTSPQSGTETPTTTTPEPATP